MGPIAVYLGLDLARTIDYTALSVVEVFERERPRPTSAPPLAPGQRALTESHYRVQRLDRLPHGMNFREQAAYVALQFGAIREELLTKYYNLHAIEVFTMPTRCLYADASGLGSPVVEQIKQALSDHVETRDVNVYPVTFIHGPRGYDEGKGTAGKTYIFRKLQALVTAQRIDFTRRDPLWDVLLREIQAFRFTLDQNGVETMGGAAPMHDDLVTALALATMEDPLDNRVTFLRKVGW
jgi:hypothetical protein